MAILVTAVAAFAAPVGELLDLGWLERAGTRTWHRHAGLAADALPIYRRRTLIVGDMKESE